MASTVDIQVRRTRSPLGYLLGDEQRRGYQDDPALDDASRRKIALWARATGEATPQQLEIIANSNPASRDTPGRIAARKALAPSSSPFWDLLTRDEQAIVLDPSSAGVGDYPLSMRELRQLTGATEDQVRFWADNDLIKAHRTSGRQRRFYSEALLRSYFCAPFSKQDVAVLMKILNGPSPGLLAAFSTLLNQRAVAEPEQELSDAFRESASGLRKASRCLGRSKPGANSKSSGNMVIRKSVKPSAHKPSVKRSAKSGVIATPKASRAKKKSSRAA